MENFCKGVVFGMMLGVAVGAVVVAKNKKLAVKIKDGVSQAETKLKEAKDMIEEKIEESQENEKPETSSSSQSRQENKKLKN